MNKRASKAQVAKRPDIFGYHDYVAFLKDWLAYRKASQSGFSLRTLARMAGLASGYLPMVLGGKRELTGKALAKLSPFLELENGELSFLQNLVSLGTSGTHEARRQALERMGRFRHYRQASARETEVYRYLTHWYYVAIREMAALPGFQLDAAWVQSRLCASVPLQEIKGAIEFLVKNGYLKTDPAGRVLPPDERALDCTGDVYRVALAQYHREIFELAARSIESVPREERQILGHSFALSRESFAEASRIVEEAIERVRALGERHVQGDAIYHLELALFPLANGEGEGKDESKKREPSS